MSGISLTLLPGLRWSGRIAFDAQARTPPADLTSLRLRPLEVTGAAVVVPFTATRPDGTFEITSLLPGTYSMTSTVDEGWWLRSVIVNGRDVLDFPLDLGPGGDVSGAVATFTDRHTELTGTLQTAANAPAPDHFVVAFAADRAFWRPAARRIQSQRPSTDGRFVFRDLPPGDYLIAALTDMEPADLLDVAFLEGLVPAAVPVRLAEGERRTQDLRIARYLSGKSTSRVRSAAFLQVHKPIADEDAIARDVVVAGRHEPELAVRVLANHLDDLAEHA